MDRIFDVMFNGMSALQQLIMLIVGLVLFMVGAALVYEDKRFRKKARRHQATLVGLREGKDGDGGKTYYPVAEYTGPEGKMIRAECDSGASTYIDKVPGSLITIYVDPAKPEKFRLPGKVFFVVGMIFAAVGGAIAVCSITVFKITPMTPIVGGLFLLWGYFKFREHIKPREMWENPAEFIERKQAEFTGERSAMPMLDKEAVLKVQKKNRETFLRFGWILFVIAGGLIYFGSVTARDLQDIIKNGTPTQGRVVDMATHSDSDGTTYSAIVEFTDISNQPHRFQDKVGSSSPLNSVGDEVLVIYKEEEPGKAIVDRGIWNWALPAAFLGIGSVMALLALQQYISVSRRHSRR